MAKKKIELIIDAETKKIKSKLKDVSKQVDKFGKDAKKSTKQGSDGFLAMAKKVGLVAAAMMALKKGFKFIKDSLSKFGEQEQIVNRLAVSLGKSTKGLEEYASAMQQVTIYGDEEILMAMNQMSAFTKEEDQIKQLTKATLDMAAAKGMTLVSAGELISKTFGSTTNALTRYGVSVEGAVGSAERLKQITEGIGELWSGQAKASADTYKGAIIQMHNAIGDLQERIGSKFAPALMRLAKGMQELVEIPVSETIEKERIQFNTLLDILQDINVSQSTRNTTIETLQNQYPDYIDNIDLEKAAIKDIAKFQKEVNESMLERIRIEAARGMLAEKEEKLIKQKAKEYKIDYDLKEQKYKIIEQREKLVELGRKDREQGEESRKEQALGYTTQQGILNSLIEHETHLTGKLENKRNKVKELQAEYDKFYKFLIENKTIEEDNKKNIVDLTEKELIALEKINEQIRTYNDLTDNPIIIPSAPLAPVDVENIEEAKDLILELGTVYEQVFARRKEQHEANKEMELKGAALSGNTAIGAMKNVVSAELMEAIAGLLASILKSVPFPFNLLVAAGAGGLAKGLMDKALGGIKDKFASGGSMMVTGSGGADSQTIPIRVSPGERATTIIETPQQINNNNNVQIIGDFTITGRDLHYVLKKYEDDIL